MFTKLPSRSPTQVAVETTFCFITDIVSLVGNFLVCLAVYKNSRLRTTVNLYIVTLAISDLLAATTVLPLSAGVFITGRWIYGQAVCELQAFAINLVILVMPATMGIMAFNRYIKIAKPLRYSTIFSARRSSAYVVAIWVCVTLYVGICRIVGWYKFDFIPGYTACHVIHLSEQRKAIHYVFTCLFFVIPFGTAMVSYFKIFKLTRQHNRNVVFAVCRNQLGPTNRRLVAQTREIKITKALFAVIFTLVICWLPSAVISLVFRFKGAPEVPRNLQMLSAYLIYVCGAINPFIYAGMNGSFRQTFRRMCTKRERIAPVPPDRFVG